MMAFLKCINCLKEHHHNNNCSKCFHSALKQKTDTLIWVHSPQQMCFTYAVLNLNQCMGIIYIHCFSGSLTGENQRPCPPQSVISSLSSNISFEASLEQLAVPAVVAACLLSLHMLSKVGQRMSLVEDSELRWHTSHCWNQHWVLVDPFSKKRKLWAKNTACNSCYRNGPFCSHFNLVLCSGKVTFSHTPHCCQGSALFYRFIQFLHWPTWLSPQEEPFEWSQNSVRVSLVTWRNL